MLYRTYSDTLRHKYGEKVYKLPVNISGSCPNRDGTVGIGGCTFCGEKGTGFENLSSELTVAEQLDTNMKYIGKRYGAKKFIAYFQNYTNTYLPIEELSEYLDQACRPENVVEICLSTRPDCISDRYLELIQTKASAFGKNVTIELGLQSSNWRTLDMINRGHTLAEFIDAVFRIHEYGFEICAHVILNLPWDEEKDCIETAKILTALKVEHVKLHSLYIENATVMAQQYERGEFQIISAEEYVQRAVSFLEYVSPNMTIQRLVSRAPEEDTVFCNWSMSWWRIRDMIEALMHEKKTFQGARCDYINKDFRLSE